MEWVIGTGLQFHRLIVYSLFTDMVWWFFFLVFWFVCVCVCLSCVFRVSFGSWKARPGQVTPALKRVLPIPTAAAQEALRSQLLTAVAQLPEKLPVVINIKAFHTILRVR
jgi:hypothetical protein